MGTCMQSFSGLSLKILGKTHISAFLYNPARNQLAVASSRIAIASKFINPPEVADISAHDFPVTCVCYSSLYEEVFDISEFKILI